VHQVAEHAERDHGLTQLPPQIAEAVAQAWQRSDAPT